MKTTKMLKILVVALGLVVCQAGVSEAAPMGTAFTYQGHLYDANYAANGLYDFQFKLFDDPNVIIGNQIGGDVNVPDVDVIDALFTVELDFGSVFDGNSVWLEIGVRLGDQNDPNIYTVLAPRQEVTPAPYALNSAGLTLPYVGIASGSGGPVFSITNAGTGSAIKGTGQNGYGVQGESFAAGNSGVFGINNTTGGYGVFGWSDSGTGVKGYTSGTGVAGLFQIASMGNSNAALEGRTNSTGTGIFGWATSGGGTNYGVRGRTESVNGYAGYFEGRVYAGGSVGIGTEIPNYKLEVKAPTNQALKLSTESTNSNVDIEGTPTGSGAMRVNVFGGANAITLNVNNSEKVRMNSNGDVGIGTASPGARLEVNGQVKVTGGSPGAGKVLTSDAGGLATWQTPSAAADSDWQVSGVDMYSIPSGKVGIGSTTPRGKLDVKGEGSNIYLDTGTAQIYIGDKSGDGDETLFTLDDDAGKFTFENGNVGIGTTTPAAKLEVAGDVKISGSSSGGTIAATNSDASGYGVYGVATTGGDVTNYGGYFESLSKFGAGVYGLATNSYGGKGVWGKATGDAGIGVYGETPGNVNPAVMGVASNTSGGKGVLGTAAGTSGIGIRGEATSSSGTNYGVYGMTNSPNGYAGYFNGNVNTSASYEIGGQNGLSVSGTGSLSVGPGAGANNTGNYNTFSGYQAGLNNTTGYYNTFSGCRAGYSNTAGIDNTFSGYMAGHSNMTGNCNTFSGGQAGYNNTAGHDNTFSGHLAGYNNTIGHDNTFSGELAGYNNTTGSYNTFLGVGAGYSSTIGEGNVFIGHDAGYDETGSNKLYIANTSTATPLIYGDFAGKLVEINGTLDVKGPIWQRGVVLHADYVFKPGYELESIDKHSEFMWQNKHLPAIPKAMTDENGREIVEVGAHRRGIVEELEKAHIYIDQLHKQNMALETRLAKLEAIVAQMSIAQKGKIR